MLSKQDMNKLLKEQLIIIAKEKMPKDDPSHDINHALRVLAISEKIEALSQVVLNFEKREFPESTDQVGDVVIEFVKAFENEHSIGRGSMTQF